MLPGLTNGMAILREYRSSRRGNEADDNHESRAIRSETCHDVPISAPGVPLKKPRKTGPISSPDRSDRRNTGKIPRAVAGNPTASRPLESRTAKQLRSHGHDDRAQGHEDRRQLTGICVQGAAEPPSKALYHLRITRTQHNSTCPPRCIESRPQ